MYIEANSFGVPVISGSFGGAAEAVKHGISGLQCDATPLGIYSSIIKVIKHPLNVNKIIEFAENHDYRKQQKFVDYIFNCSSNSHPKKLTL